MTKHAYTIKEASQATGISRSSLYLAIKSGELGIRKLGSRTLILAPELDRWLLTLPRSTKS